MSSRNASWPGDWSDTEGMERIDTKYIPEIPGAILHFSARGLPEGPMQTWYDLISGTPWSSTSGATAPLVTKDSQDNSVLYFDGIDDMFTMPLVLSQPHTIIIMAKFREYRNSSLLVSGATGPSNTLGINSASTGWTHYAGSTLALTGVAPDTLIHTFMSVSNGANSVIAVGDLERVGDAGTNGRTFLRVGYGAGAAADYEKMNVYEVAVLPFAANATQRQTIRDMLFEAYGF